MSPELFIHVLSKNYLKIDFNLELSNIFSIGIAILRAQLLLNKKVIEGIN